MRVPVKLLGCVFWLFFFNCAQSQAKQKLCSDLFLENGFIHTLSSNEDEIFYTCKPGFKPFTGNWWDSVTCSRGYRSEEPRCIREEECGAFPSVRHVKQKQTKQIFNDGETTTFECDPGFKPTQSLIRCVNGTWETPVCEGDERCDIPPKVENALITTKPEEFYGDGSSVTYACRSSFLMNGKSTVFCRSGTWDKAPTCKEALCPLNTADEDLIMKRFRDVDGPVKPGHKLIFSCNREGLKLKGQREITCLRNGEWSSPFPKCEEIMCVANLTANMRSDGHPGPEISVRPGNTITLSCVRGELQGQSKIRCLLNGKWKVPFPKCVGGKCGPPPLVDFADTERKKKDYGSGERVEYTCFNKYTLVQSHPYSKYLTCEDGEWRGNIKCLRKCGPPPLVDSADTTEMTKNEYDSGEKVEYTCFNKFTLVQSHPYSKYLTCEDGEWRGNIKCLKPCSVSVEEMDERGIELRWGGREKIFSPDGDRIEFRCQRGKSSIGLIQTCNDGVMNLPLCE